MGESTANDLTTHVDTEPGVVRYKGGTTPRDGRENGFSTSLLSSTKLKKSTRDEVTGFRHESVALSTTVDTQQGKWLVVFDQNRVNGFTTNGKQDGGLLMTTRGVHPNSLGTESENERVSDFQHATE